MANEQKPSFLESDIQTRDQRMPEGITQLLSGIA